MKKLLCLILFCGGLLLLYGCGPANPYGTVAVTGKVMVDGAPMEGITISFVPVGGTGTAAFGMTDADGNYKLTTGGAPFGTGAIPGEYSATFSKVASSPGMSLGEFQAGGGTTSPPSSGPPKAVYLIPEKFADPKTTGFESIEVKKGGKNNFDFNIETK
jgi:hypothetical protein